MFAISYIQRDWPGGISTAMEKKGQGSTFDDTIKQEKVKLLNNVRRKEIEMKLLVSQRNLLE